MNVFSDCSAEVIILVGADSKSDSSDLESVSERVGGKPARSSQHAQSSKLKRAAPVPCMLEWPHAPMDARACALPGNAIAC